MPIIVIFIARAPGKARSGGQGRWSLRDVDRATAGAGGVPATAPGDLLRDPANQETGECFAAEEVTNDAPVPGDSPVLFSAPQLSQYALRGLADPCADRFA